MKLVPLFRFWGDKRGGEDEEDLPETLDDDLLQIPADEQPTDSQQEEGEGTSDGVEEEEKEEENPEPQALGGRDEELLKMFASVDDEYVDSSALTTEIEDVPVSELLQELHAIAAAFGRPVAVADDDPV